MVHTCSLDTNLHELLSNRLSARMMSLGKEYEPVFYYGKNVHEENPVLADGRMFRGKPLSLYQKSRHVCSGENVNG
jgi:hypothetical protein